MLIKYKERNSLLFRAIALIVVCLFLTNDIAWAQSSSVIASPPKADEAISNTPTLAAQSSFNRITPFFENNKLDFKNKAAVITAAGEIKKLITTKQLRDSKITLLNSRLSELFPQSGVEIETKLKQGKFKCSGKEYQYAVFHFKKSQKTIHVLFFEDHTKLTPAELAELRIKDTEKHHLDCPGLEGVWFINPVSAPQPPADADKKQNLFDKKINSFVNLGLFAEEDLNLGIRSIIRTFWDEIEEYLKGKVGSSFDEFIKSAGDEKHKQLVADFTSFMDGFMDFRSTFARDSIQQQEFQKFVSTFIDENKQYPRLIVFAPGLYQEPAELAIILEKIGKQKGLGELPEGCITVYDNSSTNCVTLATHGSIYDPIDISILPSKWIGEYFVREERGFRLIPRLENRIKAASFFNLAGLKDIIVDCRDGQADVLVSNNVLSYINRQDINALPAVFNFFYRLLKKNGAMLISSGEEHYVDIFAKAIFQPYPDLISVYVKRSTISSPGVEKKQNIVSPEERLSRLRGWAAEMLTQTGSVRSRWGSLVKSEVSGEKRKALYEATSGQINLLMGIYERAWSLGLALNELNALIYEFENPIYTCKLICGEDMRDFLLVRDDDAFEIISNVWAGFNELESAARTILAFRRIVVENSTPYVGSRQHFNFEKCRTASTTEKLNRAPPAIQRKITDFLKTLPDRSTDERFARAKGTIQGLPRQEITIRLLDAQATINNGVDNIDELLKAGKIKPFNFKEMDKIAIYSPSVGEMFGKKNVSKFTATEALSAGLEFMLGNNGSNLNNIISRILGRDANSSEIHTPIDVIYAKAGLIEYVFQVVIRVKGREKPVLLALHVPRNEIANTIIKKDYENQAYLEEHVNADYLPVPYAGGVGVSKNDIAMNVYINEWLTGYVEAHVDFDHNSCQFSLWDCVQGEPKRVPVTKKNIARSIGHEIFKILAFYNEVDISSVGINAGDFDVKRKSNDAVTLRLSTVRSRKTEPRISYNKEKDSIVINDAEGLLADLFALRAHHDSAVQYNLENLRWELATTMDEKYLNPNSEKTFMLVNAGNDAGLRRRISNFETVIEGFAAGIRERLITDGLSGPKTESRIRQAIIEILGSFAKALSEDHINDDYVKRHKVDIIVAINKYCMFSSIPAASGAAAQGSPHYIQTFPPRMFDNASDLLTYSPDHFTLKSINNASELAKMADLVIVNKKGPVDETEDRKFKNFIESAPGTSAKKTAEKTKKTRFDRQDFVTNGASLILVPDKTIIVPGTQDKALQGALASIRHALEEVKRIKMALDVRAMENTSDLKNYLKDLLLIDLVKISNDDKKLLTEKLFLILDSSSSKETYRGVYSLLKKIGIEPAYGAEQTALLIRLVEELGIKDDILSQAIIVNGMNSLKRLPQDSYIVLLKIIRQNAVFSQRIYDDLKNKPAGYEYDPRERALLFILQGTIKDADKDFDDRIINELTGSKNSSDRISLALAVIDALQTYIEPPSRKVIDLIAADLASLSEKDFTTYLNIIKRLPRYYEDGVPYVNEGMPGPMTFGVEIEFDLLGSDGEQDEPEFKKLYYELCDYMKRTGLMQRGWVIKRDVGHGEITTKEGGLTNTLDGFGELRSGLSEIITFINRKRGSAKLSQGMHVHIGNPRPEDPRVDKALVFIGRSMEWFWSQLSYTGNIITFSDSALLGNRDTRKNEVPFYRASEHGTFAFNIFSPVPANLMEGEADKYFERMQLTIGIAMNIVHNAVTRSKEFNLFKAGLPVYQGSLYTQRNSFLLRKHINHLFGNNSIGAISMLQLLCDRNVLPKTVVLDKEDVDMLEIERIYRKSDNTMIYQAHMQKNGWNDAIPTEIERRFSTQLPGLKKSKNNSTITGIIPILKMAASCGNQEAVDALKDIIFTCADNNLRADVLGGLSIAAFHGSQPAISALKEIVPELRNIILKSSLSSKDFELFGAARYGLKMAAFDGSQQAVNALKEFAIVATDTRQITMYDLTELLYYNNLHAMSAIKDIIFNAQDHDLRVSMIACLSGVTYCMQQATDILKEAVLMLDCQRIKNVVIDGLVKAVHHRSRPAANAIIDIIRTSHNENLRGTVVCYLQTIMNSDPGLEADVLKEIFHISQDIDLKMSIIKDFISVIDHGIGGVEAADALRDIMRTLKEEDLKTITIIGLVNSAAWRDRDNELATDILKENVPMLEDVVLKSQNENLKSYAMEGLKYLSSLNWRPAIDALDRIPFMASSTAILESPKDSNKLVQELAPGTDAFREVSNAADIIHAENLKYQPTIPEKTILCHIIMDSIVSGEQQQMLKVMVEQEMEKRAARGEEFRERVVCLSGANTADPEEFIKNLRVRIQEEMKAYNALGYTNVQFDVACPNKNLVNAILESSPGIKALAFEPYQGDEFTVTQAEGIMLALRALHSDDIEKLKAAFAFLAGNRFRLSSEQSAITDIDEFIRKVTFILPAVKVEDYNERRKINNLIAENIKQAA